MSDPGPILEHRKMTLMERLRAPDSYGLLLVMILVSIVTTAAVSGTSIGGVVTLVLLGGTLIFAMRTSRTGHRYRRIGTVLAPIMVLSAAISGAVSSGAVSSSIAAGLGALLVLAALSAIFSRLATHTTISIQTVLGALSMYLLMGLLFASVFAFLASASNDPFFAQGASVGTSINYIYFSYVTLATVGYGDLSAAGNLGKMLAASEGLIGQLFLVTVVALLVSNIGKSRRPGRAREDED